MADSYLRDAGDDPERVKLAIDYLIHMASDSSAHDAAVEMQSLAKRVGVANPRLTHRQVQAAVAAGKASGVSLDGDLNRGQVFYTLRDSKSGNVVSELVNGPDDVQAAVARASKEMKAKQKATRDRIRGERDS